MIQNENGKSIDVHMLKRNKNTPNSQRISNIASRVLRESKTPQFGDN